MMNTAHEIMSEHLMTVRPDMTCQEVMDIFNIHHITGAPVVDEKGFLVGVISVTDILRHYDVDMIYNHGYFEEMVSGKAFPEGGFHYESSASDTFVSEIMTREVHTALPDTSVESIAAIMVQNHIHRVIIIHPKLKHPIGIVTTFDMLKILSRNPHAVHHG